MKSYNPRLNNRVIFLVIPVFIALFSLLWLLTLPEAVSASKHSTTLDNQPATVLRPHKSENSLQASVPITEPVPWPALPNGYRYVKELPSQVTDNTVNGFFDCLVGTIIDCNGEVTGSDETIHGDIEYTGSFTPTQIAGAVFRIEFTYFDTWNPDWQKVISIGPDDDIANKRNLDEGDTVLFYDLSTTDNDAIFDSFSVDQIWGLGSGHDYAGGVNISHLTSNSDVGTISLDVEITDWYLIIKDDPEPSGLYFHSDVNVTGLNGTVRDHHTSTSIGGTEMFYYQTYVLDGDSAGRLDFGFEDSQGTHVPVRMEVIDYLTCSAGDSINETTAGFYDSSQSVIAEYQDTIPLPTAHNAYYFDGACYDAWNDANDGYIVFRFYPPLSSLEDSMVANKGNSCDSLTSVATTQGFIGDPINPRNGNFIYSEQDLSIPVAGCSLGFERFYASDTVDYYTSIIGHGWTHNYDMRLHFTNTEIPDTIEIQTPNGSRLPFYDNGDSTYTPYAGVTAELMEIGSTYVITGFNQKVYTFDSQGLLLEQADPYGNVITFTYNISDQLIRAGQGDRYLTYGYDGLGRLTSVMDNLDREVTLDYDTNGDLITATNALDLATTYEYSGTTHLLTKVTDPSGTVVEETAYDNEGRAHLQWDGKGNLLVEIDYSLANTRVVTENGVVMTYTYDDRNTLVGIEYACTDGTTGCQAGSNIAYDGNFKQDDMVDLNGNPTMLDWNAGGSNLEYVRNALNNETFLTYDEYNNLTQTVDARDNTTRYFYDNPNFPTFLTRMTDALDKTTYFTPTTSADGVPGLLKQQEDPDGRITAYDYNAFGQITEMVVAAGTSDAVTTTYDYDEVGRLTTTTRSSVGESYTSLNAYDDGDRLIATIGNWTGSNQANWATDCDISSGARDTNVCTRYDYDDAGRIISTTNTLGQTNLTFYDEAGRAFLNVTNWDGSSYNENDPLSDLCNFSTPDSEFNLCRQTEYDEFGRVYTTTNTLGHKNVTEYDSLGRVSRSITNWQDGIFNANDPDGDIETLYEYDANGNVLIVTDTVGRMTRTFYDALNRVEGKISNWDGSTVLDDCSSLLTMRDSNICTQYAYDEMGNTIIVTDTLGRMSRTFYDDLNRVEVTVQNWQPTLTSPDNCILSPTNNALENICTLYGYDDTGNQITMTNALNQTSLTVYDSANRPFLTVQNWDGTPISSENDCSFPPAESDTNVCFVTYFDELGRRSGNKDALGNLTDFEYDGLGRLITTTRYLDNGATPVEISIEYDALGNRLTQTDAEGNDISFLFNELNRVETSTTDEGVTLTNYYNAAGWVTQTADTLLHATTFTYDDLGRRLTVTDAETNVTEYEYDALGNQTAMIDAELVRTTYVYDDLNRLERVIENDLPGSNPTNESDVVTEYTYDALGNRIQITNARGFTNTYTVYDSLNRPWIVEDALGNQTVMLYNALGYRVVMTDGNEAVTTYGYDGLNRLETVNYLADGIVVTYEYDALGNRTVMTDDLGTTSYDYDDLYRLIEVIDPFNATVGYSYDKVGNRTHLTYPDSRVVTYTYDMDNRLETVLDWDMGTTTYEYDDASRLITTTLPNGVVSVNTFDNANRLTNLSHTSSNDVLIANFAYELDKVGNRTIVTETIRQPGELDGITAFLEENGQLVLEAESGTATAGTTHTWNSQTVQTDYAGTAYLRALPDIGQQYDASATANSPGLNFTVQIDNPGNYTVWARGMAPDAAGDSLHIGVDDNAPTTAANLTGFAPNTWSWSRLTMSNTNATVDLSSSGTYTLNVWVAEDGLRLDKLMLVTDTATIPTGQGPLASPTVTDLPNLESHTIEYNYDDLYRLTDAIYTGDITGTYSYVYDAVGNMEAYTETIDTESGIRTTVVTRTFNVANQLEFSYENIEMIEISYEIWMTATYTYDDNGNLIRIDIPSEIPDGSQSYNYEYNQRNLLTDVSYACCRSLFTTNYVYDGANNRLQQIYDTNTTTPITTTYTNDIVGLSQVLVSDDGTTTTYNLFGLDLIQLNNGSETRTLLVDSLGSVRVEITGNTIETATTYEPYGKLLAQSGSSGTEYGYTGEQYDTTSTSGFTGPTGLIYLRARHYNPFVKLFMSRDPWRGTENQSMTMNGNSYANGNPVNFIDPAGLSAIDPNCNAWPSFLADDCERASRFDMSLETRLNAREGIYNQIINMTGLAGSVSNGWKWSSFMLNHFLNGQGAGLNISFGSNHSFVKDEGITRATTTWRSARHPGDEPDDIVPLLHAFINELPFENNCNSFIQESLNLFGRDLYFGEKPDEIYGIEPRPYSRGFWGAFGHVTIDGRFSAAVKRDTMFGTGYMIEFQATYNINDNYQWFPNKSTPIPVYGSNGARIPHEWAISLENAGRANSYPFSINWQENNWAWVPEDLSFIVYNGIVSVFHPEPQDGLQKYTQNALP